MDPHKVQHQIAANERSSQNTIKAYKIFDQAITKKNIIFKLFLDSPANIIIINLYCVMALKVDILCLAEGVSYVFLSFISAVVEMPASVTDQNTLFFSFA